MKEIYILILVVLFAQNSFSQSPCYDRVRQNGINLLTENNPKYEEAIDKFWAAFECDDKPQQNDLDRQIRRAQTLLKKALNQLVERALAAKEAAVLSQKAEERAKKEAFNNWQEAKRKGEEARRKGILAESLRLAVLSSNAGQKGKKSDALELAFLAMILGKEAPQLPLKKAFFDAVRDSFSTTTFSNESYSELQVQNGGTLFTGEKELSFFSKNDLKSNWKTDPLGSKIHLFETNNFNKNVAIWSDNSLSVFDESGQKKVAISKHTEQILDVDFAKNQSWIASSSRDNSFVVSDMTTSASERKEAHEGNIYQIEFSPNDEYLLTRGADNKIKIWKPFGTQISELKNKDSYFYTATFSPDSKKILTGSADGIPKLWNLKGELIQKANFSMGAPITKVDFLGDSNTTLAFAQNGRLKIWNLDGETIYENEPSNRVEGFRILENEVLLWENNYSLKTIDKSGEVKFLGYGHKTSIINAEQSADGQYFLSTSTDGETILWDKSGNILTTWSMPGEVVQPAFFANDESVIIPNAGAINFISCPIPTLIEDDFFKNKETHLSNAKKLTEEYEIQFLEEF